MATWAIDLFKKHREEMKVKDQVNGRNSYECHNLGLRLLLWCKFQI